MQIAAADRIRSFKPAASQDEASSSAGTAPVQVPATLFDEPESWASFSHCIKGPPDLPKLQVQQSFVAVRGMRCAACALSLEAALRSVKGVSAVQVSAASATASVTWSAAVTRPSAWMGAALAMGYELLPADDASFRVNNQQQSRLALWRWLVAGFCMMQVMMYAAPTYFTKPGDVSPDIEQLLRWASWVLTLPVAIFSCGPFFSNAWRDLKQRAISMDLPVAIGIAVTFAVSTAATFEPLQWWGREVYFDSLTMFVFFLLTGRWLEQRLRSSTAGALSTLTQRLPASTLRETASGDFERVALRRLMLGDVVRVLPGEAFPADGLVRAGGTLVDEALLTGESRPVQRDVGSMVLAGSYNVANPTDICVDKLGDDTRYAQIVSLMERAALSKPRLALLADKVAKPFLVFVLLAAAGAVAFWWQTDPARALMAAVAVLIVTCPCALSLATPTAMLTTAGLLARRGVLVRHLEAIESLADIDTVIFDKTGTLTDLAVGLQTIHLRDGVSREQALQWASSLARHSLHPVSKAVVVAASGMAELVLANVKERAGQGLEGWWHQGDSAAAEFLRFGSSLFCAIGEAHSQTDLGNSALRVFLADGKGWAASFDFEETLRPDAAESVTALQALGLKVQMLSGDTQAAAGQVATQLGIIEFQGGCTPDAKLGITRALQAAGRKVLMVGDGLNDGPTLAAAHVSVAVGAAVPLAQAQSDFVVPGAQLSVLPAMFGQSKRCLRVVKQNLVWAAAYNAVCVPLALGGYLPAWLAGFGMAASSLLVIVNAARLSRFKASR
jgi:P-type Cu2+ transporter